MPLKKGKSRKTISENVRELHGGATHRRTAGKFGKDHADAQSIAIALKEARRGRKRRKHGSR